MRELSELECNSVAGGIEGVVVTGRRTQNLYFNDLIYYFNSFEFPLNPDPPPPGVGFYDYEYQDINWLSAGPHNYVVVNKIRSDHDIEKAWDALKRFAVPGQDSNTPVYTGQHVTAKLMGIPIGDVIEGVDHSSYTITNTTLLDHIMNPGSVQHTLVDRPDGIYSVTIGRGTGMFGSEAEAMSSMVWNSQDAKAVEWMNSH